MADYLHQASGYDEAKIKEQIEDLKLELQDELVLAEELSGDPEAQLAAAQEFADANEASIVALKAELDSISAQLEEAVLANKAKQAAIEELDTLVKSERYQKIADNIVSVKSKLATTHDFLVKQGVVGRRV